MRGQQLDFKLIINSIMGSKDKANKIIQIQKKSVGKILPKN